MSEATVPAWSVMCLNGSKVTLAHSAAQGMVMLEFQRDGAKTTIALTEQALSAVVQIAVSRVGVPVLVDGLQHVREAAPDA
jgi:hypothetical protein